MRKLGRRGLFSGAAMVPLTLPLAGAATALADAPLMAVIENEPPSIYPGMITYVSRPEPRGWLKITPNVVYKIEPPK